MGAYSSSWRTSSDTYTISKSGSYTLNLSGDIEYYSTDGTQDGSLQVIRYNGTVIALISLSSTFEPITKNVNLKEGDVVKIRVKKYQSGTAKLDIIYNDL